MLYTLVFSSDVCQLILNKMKDKKENHEYSFILNALERIKGVFLAYYALTLNFVLIILTPKKLLSYVVCFLLLTFIHCYHWHHNKYIWSEIFIEKYNQE